MSTALWNEQIIGGLGIAMFIQNSSAYFGHAYKFYSFRCKKAYFPSCVLFLYFSAQVQENFQETCFGAAH